MKKLVISLLLGCANLALPGLGDLHYWTHRLLDFPANIAAVPIAITFLVVPLLALATVGFAIRDFIRPAVRWPAVIACVHFIPVAIAYWPLWY